MQQQNNQNTKNQQFHQLNQKYQLNHQELQMKLEIFKEISSFQPMMLEQTPKNVVNTVNNNEMLKEEMCGSIMNNNFSNWIAEEPKTNHVTPLIEDLQGKPQRSHSENLLMQQIFNPDRFLQNGRQTSQNQNLLKNSFFNQPQDIYDGNNFFEQYNMTMMNLKLDPEILEFENEHEEAMFMSLNMHDQSSLSCDQLLVRGRKVSEQQTLLLKNQFSSSAPELQNQQSTEFNQNQIMENSQSHRNTPPNESTQLQLANALRNLGYSSSSSLNDEESKRSCRSASQLGNQKKKINFTRHRCTKEEKNILQNQFDKNPVWDRDIIEKLALELKFTPQKVYKWYYDKHNYVSTKTLKKQKSQQQ
eukprot:403372385